MSISFDPSILLSTEIHEANDTAAIPVPEGEFVAIIEKVEPRTWQGKEDPTKSGVTLDITWSIDDANVRETLGRDKVTVRQGIMLDLTDTGGLDMSKGRNIGLGRLREALDMNQPGQAFSMNNLSGRVAKILVTHRLDNRNPADPKIFPEVRGVTKM